MFVSNIDGKEAWTDDGKGSIAKVGLDGKVIEVDWVNGLNAPKGMGLKDSTLYVADNHAIVIIDIEKGEITNRFDVPDAVNINDVSVGEDGIVYFTDSALGKIHKLENGKMSTLITGLQHLNGVLHSQGELLFVADGALWMADTQNKPVKIAGGMEGGVDGLERIDKDSWLVSCWQGVVYHVARQGKVTLLLDSRPDEINAADLGYDPVKHIAYIPGFWKNFITAYQLLIN